MNQKLFDAHLGFLRAVLMKDVAQLIKCCYPIQVDIALNDTSFSPDFMIQPDLHGAELGAAIGDKYFGGDDVPTVAELRDAFLLQDKEAQKEFIKCVDNYVESQPELNNVYPLILEMINSRA